MHLCAAYSDTCANFYFMIGSVVCVKKLFIYCIVSVKDVSFEDTKGSFNPIIGDGGLISSILEACWGINSIDFVFY